MRGRWFEGRGLLAIMAGLIVLFLAAVLVAVVVLNGQVVAGRTIEQEAYIRLEPAAGEAGTVVKISGAGWQAGESVLIYLVESGTNNTDGVVYASDVADEDGQIAASFPYPGTEPWSSGQTAVVLATGLKSGDRARAAFQVVPGAAETAAPTSTPLPSVVVPTVVPDQATSVPPTATQVPPTATATQVPPTATQVPPTATQVPPTVAAVQIVDWRGEYYDNRDLIGAPRVRNDVKIDFAWGTGSPMSGMPADNFSARWTRRLDFEGRTYRFNLRIDDGARLWIDGQLVIDAWQDGSERTLSVERSMTAGQHDVRVEMYERTGDATIAFWREVVESYPDWKGEYFNNRDLAGSPIVVRNDKGIDFNWGTGAPATGLPADNFSVRWTRNINLDAGLYRFSVQVDDGARLWVDGRLVIDQWHDGSSTYTADVSLSGGTHALRLEYYERTGGALVRLGWTKQKPATPTTFSDWKGEYFNNRDLAGNPVVVRNDKNIDFSWGTGAPAAGLPADNFSVRWTRQADFAKAYYRFCFRADDGISVEIDDQKPFLRVWTDGSKEKCADLFMTEGRHKVRVEYYEHGGDAQAHFGWQELKLTSVRDGTFHRLDLPLWSETPVGAAIASQAEYTAFLQRQGMHVTAGQPTPGAPLNWSDEVLLAYFTAKKPVDGTRLETTRIAYNGQVVIVRLKQASLTSAEQAGSLGDSSSWTAGVRWSALPKGTLTFRFYDQQGRLLAEDTAVNPLR